MMTRVGGIWVHEYVCKSTDTKFTNITNPKLEIPNGSTCLEMNTGNVFLYDKDIEDWIPFTLE